MSHAKELGRGIARLIVGAALVVVAHAVLAQAPASPSTGKQGLQTGMRPWKGDFEAMAKRRLVRVLVPFSKTFYYVESGRARGVSAEIIQALEDNINRERKTGKTLRIRVVALPVGRDELLPRLNAGYGDIVIADLTITPERLKIVDFATPMFRGIPEVVVTGPAGADVPNLDALAGKEVFVRKGTSYWEHLDALNKRFASEGKVPVGAREAPDDLEAEAIGVMQIMPATGKDLKVGDIREIDNNVHGGVKYMRFMIDQYFKNEPMTPLNKGLLAFAAYNCGPGRVAQLRKEAGKRGLDPNRWFHNVELVAADKIGPETVTYVSNIYNHYTAYKLIEQQDAERKNAREALGTPKK